MKLSFTKMQGCGNDYIYIDCISMGTAWMHSTSLETLAKRLSDRHFGIGGDGIVLILPSSIANARMRMFNLDGSEGTMCGNAIRCVACYLYEKGIVQKRNMIIETLSGCKQLQLTLQEEQVTMVSVNMGMPQLDPVMIPVQWPGTQLVNERMLIAGHGVSLTCVSMGNPHAVIFHRDLDCLNLTRIGPIFEHHTMFPDGINTEFVHVIDRTHLRMRVWERGSGETLACGTGACAAVVAACLLGYCEEGKDIQVQLAGGELTICYQDGYVNMQGPCAIVFEGSIEVSEGDQYEKL